MNFSNKRTLQLALSTFLYLGSFGAGAQIIALQEVLPTLRRASLIEVYPDPNGGTRMFMAHQDGVIRRVDLAAPTQAAVTVLNITNKTVGSGEMGLLGFAFHPQFRQNGYLFVNYSDNVVPGRHRNIIARYPYDSTRQRFDTAQKLILLTYTQPFSNHNGGHIEFGPEGHLYIATGDGGSGNDPLANGQNKTNLLGKILRINVDRAGATVPYSIPSDNPFVDSTRAGIRKEIYAYGLRNPWKFAFDARRPSRAYIADVGQGQYEEVDTLVRGGNYGWKYKEGNLCLGTATQCATPGLIAPIYEYLHNQVNGVSITGGRVYYGSALPTLQGSYFFSDYATGQIWVSTLRGGVTQTSRLLRTDKNITTYGFDNEGEIYVNDYSSGAFYKIIAGPTAIKVKKNLDAKVQVYPNPVSDELTFELKLPTTVEKLSIQIYALSGERLEQVAIPADKRGAGDQRIIHSMKSHGPGAYIYRVQVGAEQYTGKVVVSK